MLRAAGPVSRTLFHNDAMTMDSFGALDSVPLLHCVNSELLTRLYFSSV